MKPPGARVYPGQVTSALARRPTGRAGAWEQLVVSWLPDGRTAAVVFTVDDVHPGRSSDPYEAGGDLGQGALGNLEWLLERHPLLHATLFATADWREISPVPTRTWISRIPWVADRVMLAPIHPVGTMAIDRHPAFAAYLRGLPRTDVALHGLHHVHVGARLPVEFQADTPPDECREKLLRAREIFRRAGLPEPRGMTPPAWDAPPALLAAMVATGFSWVASARDIATEPTPGARTAMSGLRGVDLMAPERLSNGLVHLPTNFQATSPLERAVQIVEAGGLLSIKAHIVKNALGYVMLDGLDGVYRNLLDLLFGVLERRYGDGLWWTSMDAVAARLTEAGDAVAHA